MTPQDASAYAREICGLAPVIPVIVVHDVAHAVPLAEALVAGGLPVLEVTLRTPAALEVIRAMAEVAGRRRRRRHAADAGRRDAPPRRPARSSASRPASPTSSSPPARPRSCRCSAASPPSPRRCGCSPAATTVCKFFPAEANGGAPALKSFAGPLPQMSFCPTGGVTPKNAPDYLALPNVLCVGGSWVCDADAAEGRRVGRRSKRLARDASQLEEVRR